MDINGPSDWIHCPDEAVRERIAREMRERRYAQFVTQRLKGAPFSRVMRGEKLTGEYPLVHWSGKSGNALELLHGTHPTESKHPEK